MGEACCSRHTHTHTLSLCLLPSPSTKSPSTFPLLPLPHLPPQLTSPTVQSSPILPPRRIQRQQNAREFLVRFSIPYPPSLPCLLIISPPLKSPKTLTPPTQDLERQIHTQRSIVYSISISLSQPTHITSHQTATPSFLTILSCQGKGGKGEREEKEKEKRGDVWKRWIYIPTYVGGKNIFISK